MAQQRINSQQMIRLAVSRDTMSLFMASLVGTLVLALSLYYSRVDLMTAVTRTALTVLIVYPVTFVMVWRVITVAVAELRAAPRAPRAQPTDDTETNPGEGA
jgi:hypothetical protein